MPKTNTEKVKAYKKALVIGGGVAGIQAALDIAKAGFPVVLVEKKPFIGGHTAQLAKIFPAIEPAAQVLTPLMSEVAKHPNIELLTLSEVTKIDRRGDGFYVHIKKKPRYVDIDKCDLCSERGPQCVEVCPISVPSEFDEGLTLRKAIYMPFSQAVPQAYTIDKDVCISCGKCAQPEVCSPGAVNLADEEKIVEEKVGVVIVATGYELYSQENLGEYGVNECFDVITALQFERLLSKDGPTAGMPKRLSDGKIPKRIAFIHCAGSRSEKHVPYCSNICCAYLAKQAVLFKRLVPDGEVYSLYVDLVAAGKEYESIIKRAREEPGVNYIRAEVSKIYEQNGKVKILCVDKTHASKSVEIEVDMTVLALPMVVSSDVKELAELMRIKMDKYGFLREAPSVEPSTSRIFIAGCAQTPMDVQGTLTQAKTVADRALELLSQTKPT
jgi:heterodisulfide reductase subunit A